MKKLVDGDKLHSQKTGKVFKVSIGDRVTMSEISEINAIDEAKMLTDSICYALESGIPYSKILNILKRS